MIKKLLFAAALLSLALASGCATGGSGPGPAVTVKVKGPIAVAYVTQTNLTFTATVSNTNNTAVTWSLSGTACTGSGNPCGTIVSATSTTGTYTAPTTAPNPATVTIVATSVADTTASGSDTIRVAQVTVNVTPATANVGVGLTQQFTAVAVPDDAPQTFTWTSPPTCTTPPCGTIVPDVNNPGLAVYTAPNTASATNGVQVTATSTLDSSGIAQANVTVVKSRLGGNSNVATNFAFRFTGFDNSAKPTALTGNFVVNTDGHTITSGVADGLTVAGPQHYAGLTGGYVPSSNNHGTITLNLSGGPSFTYTVVIDASGDIGAIEADGNGTGSGVIEQLSKTPSGFNAALLNGVFVFGFTGLDSVNGKRTGYAGLLQMDGAGNISSGQLDINDGGTASTASDLSGTYSMSNGVGTIQFASVSLTRTFNFDIYGATGQINSNNPLTLYAVSTDSTATNPGVSGTVVYQDPKGSPYNNATMNTVSVASLTGADNGGANVSLTLVNLDGAGNLNGNFDQNDAGTILSVSSFSTGYTYLNTSNGRYTMQLLGTATKPLSFILYASGNGRGFLLDQSSPSVITGTLTPQGKGGGTYAASQLPGTFAAATTSSGASGVTPLAANLLFTWVNPSQGLSGTEYVGTSVSQAVTGTYKLADPGGGTGGGTSAVSEMILTAPAAQTYAIYVVDTSGCTGQEISCTLLDFLAVDLDAANTFPSVIFARQ